MTRDKNSSAPAKTELAKFRKQYCYFGSVCSKVANGECKKDHSKYPDKDSWRAAAKKHGYKPKDFEDTSSSGSDRD